MPKDYLTGLHPVLIDRIQKVLAAMAAIGYPMKPYSGVRTTEEQYQLWRKGRDLPGARVTDADGTHVRSNHQVKTDGFGHAVDCCFEGPDPWSDKMPWKLYRLLGETVGLRATLFKGDWTHLELP